MIDEITLQIFRDVSTILKTRLPYPWDFCRLKFKPNTRLLFNSGSYFLIYAAFIFWFVKYTIQHLGGSNFSAKNWMLTAIMALATATQVIWPNFLLSMYFLSCSYYPWMSALVVLLLNLPLPECTLILHTFNRSSRILKAAGSIVGFSLDAVNSRVETSGESLEDTIIPPLRQSVSDTLPSTSANEESVEKSHDVSFADISASGETVPYSSSSSEEITETSTPYILSHKSRSEPGDIITASSKKKPVKLFPSSPVLAIQRESLKMEQLKTKIEGLQQKNEVFQKMPSVVDPVKIKEYEYEVFYSESGSADFYKQVKKGFDTLFSKKLSMNWLLGTETKKGYCGRCFKEDYLPFRQGFTELRKPFNTRSGLVYGPTRRFLKIGEFVKQYGLH